MNISNCLLVTEYNTFVLLYTLFFVRMRQHKSRFNVHYTVIYMTTLPFSWKKTDGMVCVTENQQLLFLQWQIWRIGIYAKGIPEKCLEIVFPCVFMHTKYIRFTQDQCILFQTPTCSSAMTIHSEIIKAHYITLYYGEASIHSQDNAHIIPQ